MTCTKILHRDYVNIFGYTYLQVGSGSMEDAIKTNDIVIDKLLNENSPIEINDIISFREEDAIITHRVISIVGDTIITKGDANNVQDDPINRNQVIGKVVKIISGLSIWMSVFATKSVYIMMIITFMLLIITFSIDINDNKDDNTFENKMKKEAKEDTLEETNEKKEKKDK